MVCGRGARGRGWGELGGWDWHIHTAMCKVKVKVAQSCLTLWDPMDYTVHGILQARALEWVAFSFSRGSSQPRDRTQVSRIAGGFFTIWATREAQEYWGGLPFSSPGDLPNPGIEPRCPALQADALPSEPPGKFKWLLKLFLRCLWETLPHLFIKPLETTYNFLILYHLLSPYHLIFSTWRSEKLKVSLTWQMFLRW